MVDQMVDVLPYTLEGQSSSIQMQQIADLKPDNLMRARN